MNRYLIAFTAAAMSIGAMNAQSVLTGDAYIYNSVCVGLDCVVPEGFGFFTLKLKENNTQIRFEDTSTPGGTFPTMDWTIGANETGNGGKNLFFIDDELHRIVSIAGGAPTHSLFVDPNGNIGLKTGTPAVELHLNDMDTPTLRLEQNGNGGYTPQTWDVAGNEANFFIRDLTAGGTLPFRIYPGASTNSVVIHPSGNVSMGVPGSPPPEPVDAKLYVNGSLKVNGNITALSDRRVKTNISELDYGLKAILQLSPKKYEYIQDINNGLNLAKGVQLGLIAQDVESVIPEIVHDGFQVADSQGTVSQVKGLEYMELIPVLIKAIQEQQVLIEKQNEEIALIKSRMASLDQWVEKVLDEVWK